LILSEPSYFLQEFFFADRSSFFAAAEGTAIPA
jgi:hypothetical protein